jgi:hypothetical protein
VEVTSEYGQASQAQNLSRQLAFTIETSRLIGTTAVAQRFGEES